MKVYDMLHSSNEILNDDKMFDMHIKKTKKNTNKNTTIPAKKQQQQQKSSTTTNNLVPWICQ